MHVDLQVEKATKHLQLEQQKAEQDRAKWMQQEAEMQQRLEDSVQTTQTLQDSKASIEHEHSNLQELHKQLMTELQQRTGQLPQVRIGMPPALSCCSPLHLNFGSFYVALHAVPFLAMFWRFKGLHAKSAASRVRPAALHAAHVVSL